MARAFSLVCLAGVAVAALSWVTYARTQPPVSYRVISTDGAQSLPVHASTATADIITLDAAANLFGLMVREDTRAGGVVVTAGADRVVLTAGQSTVSSGGRVISLSAPVTRAGTTWLVPVDFLRAVNRGIEVRRGSRLIVVAPAVVPRVTPRFERTPSGGRLVLSVDPAATSRVTRDGALVTVRFQANALDAEPLTGAPTGLIVALRSDGPTLLVDLGASVTDVRIDETRDPAQVSVELVSAMAPPATAPTPPAPTAFDRTPGIRTVVIDPGHGGEDEGTRHPGGMLEKNVTLAVAHRVKALLEARLGVRVVLTRDGDTAVPPDRRAAMANNNKADLFVSLHANGSPTTVTRGAQVLSLDGTDYERLDAAAPRSDAPAVPVAVVGGGTRLIGAVPWQLAQLPHVPASATWASIVARRLADAGVTMHPRPVDTAALRVLVGANMPAVLVELGFLTHADDAQGLADAAHVAAIADAIVSAIADVRLGIPAASPGGMLP